MNRHLTILGIILAVCLAGCGPKKATKPAGKSQAVEETSAQSPTLHFNIETYDLEPVYDAYSQVASVVEATFALKRDGFDLAMQPNHEPLVLATEYYAFVKGFVYEDLTDAEQAVVQTLCGTSYVSFAGTTTVVEATSTADTSTQTFFVHWRSHFGQKLGRDLATLLLKHAGELRCGLRVWPEVGEESGNTETLVFDPAPVEIDGVAFYAGTKYPGVALAEAVMLLATDGVGAEPDGFTPVALDLQLPSPSDAGDPTVAAVNAQNWLPTVTVGDDLCRLKLTDSYAANDETATFFVAVASEEVDVAIAKAVVQAPVGETLTPECEALAITIAEDAASVVAELNCGQLAALINAGKTGCDLAVTVAPQNDERSQVEARVVLAFDHTTEDLRDAEGAMSIFPQTVDNPLRNANVTLTGFAAAQETALESAFDIWLETSRYSYDQFFVGKINSIVFDTVDPVCDTAGAFAVFGDDKFSWCIGGAMQDENLTPEASPYAAVYRSLTALHETLHTHGRPHDFVDTTIPSCTDTDGTAYSAVIAVDVFQCPHDYCYGLKDTAKEQLISEINYSLQDDDRRFSGACAAWAAALGVEY